MLREKEGRGSDDGVRCEPRVDHVAMPGEEGDWRETEEEKGGNVNSRQHVQPCKSDLGGQCSPCKQAIVVRRRESIGSPLSLG